MMANPNKEKNDALSQDAILTAEFDYIAQATFQANEDRARVTHFYLVTLGSFIAAILSNDSPFSQSSSVNLVNIAFGFLFLLLTFQGVLTLLQLARLRGAWFESVQAMNQIKDYYQDQFPDIKKAFRWQNKTLPSRYKRNSVGYYLALQISLLSGITLAAALGEFLSSVLPMYIILPFSLAIIVLSIFILMGVFKRVVEAQ
jgi:hypothetical protein